MIQNTLFKILRWVLAPLSLLYALVLRIRNVFFDKGIFKHTSFDIPVIAVGNLSVGGTGKTSLIEYVRRLFEGSYNIAVLSRGYKRSSEGFVLADENTVMEEIGDEPFQFFKKFKHIKVAVDTDRTNGIKEIQRKDPAVNLILLDDAFQHRKVKADFYTLLTSYESRYTKDFVLPLGNLREARSGAKRAHAILVTKCPAKLAIDEKIKITAEIDPKPYQQVFFSSISYDTTIKSVKNTIEINALKDYEIVLVTGIAKPAPLLAYLSELKIKFTHIDFPDHHNFKDADIHKIETVYASIKNTNKLILTTEKDYTRLSNAIENLYSLGIRSVIEDNQRFDNFIKESISK